jgi:signal transduction histidine kinase
VEAWARNDLLATISHDVRTPVAGIVEMLDIMLPQPVGHRTRELVESIQSSAVVFTLQ